MCEHVVQGTKYSMAKWIHVGHFAVGGERPVAIEQEIQPLSRPASGACEDKSEFCGHWAAAGETQGMGWHSQVTTGSARLILHALHR